MQSISRSPNWRSVASFAGCAAGFTTTPRRTRKSVCSVPSQPGGPGAGAKLRPAYPACGAFAANLLGLSEQVPARVVFLTDGTSRKVLIGRLIVELRKAAPRHLALAGKMSGTVIQALRHLGKDHVTAARVATLQRVLNATDRQRLGRDARFAPAWMRPHLHAVAEESRHA